jgi:histidinol phosphatase-like enzyme (inositol monophosphatase family)
MSLDPAEVKSRLLLALQAAREAGQITLDYFRREDLAVQLKADDSPVTIADRRAEEHLRDRIAGAFAGDAIVGEEMADRRGTSPFRWILDPIDGTKSFIHGIPLYGTLIGVEHDSDSVLGVIHIPALDECVYAARGQGAWYVAGGRSPCRARVSSRPTLADSLFLTSEVRSFDRIGRRDAYDRLQSAARLSRTWGDCYGYLMVATGRADVMVDPLLEIWDMAALAPVIDEAGGTFTDWQGRRTIYSGNGVATNGLVHDEVLAITRTSGNQSQLNDHA